MQIDLSIFNPKARPLLGLDISSSSIKMVELSEASKGSYRIERYAIETLPRDAVVDGNIANLEAVSEAVKRAWKRMGTSTKFVAMALPAAAVITKKIIVPAGQRERELEIQVESEANQYIPFALDEVNLDFQVVGPAPSSPEEMEVLIAASRKEKVEDRVAVAEAAGLKPLVMDVESYAAQSAFELVEGQFPEGGKNQTIALIDIGANVMNVTVLRNDQPVYAREQAFGGGQLTQDIVRQYGMSHEEAVALKDALEAAKVKLAVKAGKEGRLFGAVKPADVADAVKAAGLGELDKRKIHITAPIKAVGEHEATVRLRDDLTAVITLQVVAAK